MLNLRISELHPTALFPSCLDDQWLDRDGLYQFGAFNERVADRRAIAEFKRCLLSGKQVILNRAFIINNSALWKIWEDDQDGAVLDGLLEDGTLVAYLHKDRHPSFEQAATTVELHRERLQSWRAKVERIDVSCTRLTWEDEDDNARLCSELLENRFSERLMKLLEPGAEIILPNLVPRGTCTPEALAAFARFLDNEFRSALEMCRDPNGIVHRGRIYQHFQLGRDRIAGNGDPFRKEVKQIVDLIYNSNLSDALEISPVAPQRSACRADLSEDGAEDDDTLVLEARQVAALMIQSAKVIDGWAGEAAMPEFIPEALAFPEIVRIRRETDEWRLFIQANLALSKTIASANRDDPVGEMVCRLERVSETGNNLRDALLKSYSSSRYWKTPGISRSYDLVTQWGAAKAVATAGAAVSYLAGFGGPELLGIPLVAQFAENKARQAIDSMVNSGRLNFAAARMPRFELDASREAAEELYLLLDRAGARRVESLEVNASRVEHIMEDVKGYG